MFALLEHDTTSVAALPDGPRVRHWDLLLEVAGQALLATWRLSHDPCAHAGDIPAERLKDHRPLYLEYEGELSDGRGRVRRVDRGDATLTRLEGDEAAMTLAGTRLQGRWEITRRGAEGLVLRRSRLGREFGI